MEIWQAIIMAVVEGVTEFLPVSSTAHLMFTAGILKIPQTDFVKSFEIAIQLGAIFSVITLYFKKLIQNPSLVTKILVAFIPTGILGLFLYKLVKHYLLGNSFLAILAMFVGGVLIFVFPKFKHQHSLKDLSSPKLFVIGLFQSLSMIPGLSRSLATIWGGQIAGLSKQEAVEMSFLLAVPTMAAATGLDLLKSGFSFTSTQWFTLILGFIFAFLSALAVVKWLINYVQKHDFSSFGWYRIVLATLWGGFIFSQSLP